MIYLEGKGVKLSAGVPNQALEWRNTPAINRWCRQHTDISIKAHLAWLAKIETDPSIKMFTVSDLNGNDIGVCGLTSIDQLNQKAEFSLYIAPKFSGAMRGFEALQTLVWHGFRSFNLNRIWGEVFAGNPAMDTFLRVGFQKEGCLRQSYFRDGQFIDSHIISVIRGEEKCS